MINKTASPSPMLLPGETIEIRSREEILQTLDENGQLDGLPFMPEMLEFCGQTHAVYRRADKTCDTIDNLGAMRMQGGVHLNGLRCSGQDHGGCQAACLLFWKEAWLKRSGTKQSVTGSSQQPPGSFDASALTRATQKVPRTIDGEKVTVFACQATELKHATTPMNWWDISQYVRDIRIGNATMFQIFRAAGFFLFREIVSIGIGYRYLIAAYDWVQDQIGGQRFPFRGGKLTGSTPTGELNLEVGELVKVKSHEEILETLDQNSKNRGLWFDAEMVPNCGKVYRVSRRVTQIIHEKTGEMMNFKNPCIVLDNVCCRGRFTKLRLFCPRSIQSYWREIWLERVTDEKLANTPE